MFENHHFWQKNFLHETSLSNRSAISISKRKIFNFCPSAPSILGELGMVIEIGIDLYCHKVHFVVLGLSDDDDFRAHTPHTKL